MRFASFSSGSSGNCEYIGNSTTKLLLDAESVQSVLLTDFLI